MTVSSGSFRQALHDARIADAEVVVVARAKVDSAARLERDGSIAIKFQLIFPPIAVIREAVRPQQQHRVNEAALRLRRHHGESTLAGQILEHCCESGITHSS